MIFNFSYQAVVIHQKELNFTDFSLISLLAFSLENFAEMPFWAF